MFTANSLHDISAPVTSTNLSVATRPDTHGPISVLNNQLPVAAAPCLSSPAHGINLGHKNNLHSYPSGNAVVHSRSARPQLSPLNHQEQLICAFKEPEVQAFETSNHVELLNCKSNLLRVQLNQCQLIDYGFLEPMSVHGPEPSSERPSDLTAHANRRAIQAPPILSNVAHRLPSQYERIERNR
jgi:hypothetical protein